MKTEKQKTRINRQRRILKKRYQNYDKLEQSMKNVIFQMNDDELEHLSFCVIFEEHITEYIKDCLISLRDCLLKREKK